MNWGEHEENKIDNEGLEINLVDYAGNKNLPRRTRRSRRNED